MQTVRLRDKIASLPEHRQMAIRRQADLIRMVMWASKMTAVSYGETDWPSRSYRLFVFEAE